MSRVGRWSGLELRHLLALRAIADEGSFHRAAAALGYTQSGISQQIAALERIVGARLLERPGGSRPVRLTEAGDVLLAHARAVLERMTAAQGDVAALRAGDGGTLHVGAFQSIGPRLLAALLDGLARDGSALRVSLTQTTSDPELFELLDAGELDVTFAMLPVPDGPFAFRELFPDPFVALVPADSPLAARTDPLPLRELAAQPLIAARRCRSSAALEAQVSERGLRPGIVHRSDDNGTVGGLVATGAGVAVVPRLVADGIAGGAVAVVELAERLPPRRVGLAWHRDRNVPATRDAFVARVEATCRALGLAA